MSIFAPLASGLLSQRAVNRVARAIPNPALRYLALLAATTVVPYLAARAVNRWKEQSERQTHLFPKSR